MNKYEWPDRAGGSEADLEWQRRQGRDPQLNQIERLLMTLVDGLDAIHGDQIRSIHDGRRFDRELESKEVSIVTAGLVSDGLPTITAHRLAMAGILTIREANRLSDKDLLGIRCIGKKRVAEIRALREEAQ